MCSLLKKVVVTAVIGTLVPLATAACPDPSPAYPVPNYDQPTPYIDDAITKLQATVAAVIASLPSDDTFIAVEFTSKAKTLGGIYHSPKNVDSAKSVDGDTVFRIASISKTFTVLGILKQHAAGTLRLDDPIEKHVKELRGPKKNPNDLPFKDITLRSLASQLSGIPRESIQSDLLDILPDPTEVGLPPHSKKGQPTCDEASGYTRPCGRKDFIDIIKNQTAVFAPNQRSTYSNDAYVLLGLALADVTGKSYEDYIQEAIFDDIGMNNSSFKKPADSTGAIPDGFSFWDIDLGVNNPTGGIYTSASDMSKYLRFVLTRFNGITPAENWFNPHSFAGGTESTYGMPWEIFRTARKAAPATSAPVTYITKGGSVPGYYSGIALLPDFELGVTILVAGQPILLGILMETILPTMAAAAENEAAAQADARFAGRYVSTDPKLNSSIEVALDPRHGLLLKSFISNGTDTLRSIKAFEAQRAAYRAFTAAPFTVRAALTPTLLYADQARLRGDIFRIVPAVDDLPGVFSAACFTDVDPISYAGKPVNEFVFWDDPVDKHSAAAVKVELPAWGATLERMRGGGAAYPDEL